MRLRDLMHKSQNPGGPTGLPGLPMVTALESTIYLHHTAANKTFSCSSAYFGRGTSNNLAVYSNHDHERG